MRLTVYTDYALRLLMYLAVKDDGLATIEEVAQSYGISKNHLMKVAHQLGVAGYVDTVRGRRGGLRRQGLAQGVRLFVHGLLELQTHDAGIDHPQRRQRGDQRGDGEPLPDGRAVRLCSAAVGRGDRHGAFSPTPREVSTCRGGSGE